MAIIDTEQFVMPNDPATIKKIKDCMFEISSSFTRTEGEKDFIKEAIAELSETTEIPKKFLNRIAKIYHKQNRDAVGIEQENTGELYDRIFVSEQV